MIDLKQITYDDAIAVYFGTYNMSVDKNVLLRDLRIRYAMTHHPISEYITATLNKISLQSRV